MDLKKVDKEYLDQFFSETATLKKYKKGECLYHQGDTTNCFYYLRKGKVRNYILTEDGKEKTSTITISGEFFGITSFSDSEISDTTAQAMEQSEIFAISEDGMKHLLKSEPEIVATIMKAMAQKIRFLSLQMTSLAFLSAEKKIALMLIHLSERFSTHNKQTEEITISCTHEDIALLSSTSRTTVTQVLNNLEKQGLLKTSYRSVILHDIEKFKKILL